MSFNILDRNERAPVLRARGNRWRCWRRI